MQVITVDFETFYSQDYSLSKITTEEYVRDPRFQIIGVGVKVGAHPTGWFSGSHKQIKEYLSQFDWANSAVLAHNTMFDGSILSWRLGIRPKVWFDTLCMARAIHGVEKSASLKSLAENYGVGQKGTEVLDAKGKRRADFTEAELAAYGNYCKNDVDLTYDIFNTMAATFPRSELKLIDMTLRMFTEPTLALDKERLEGHLQKTQTMKEDLLKSAGVADRSDLMSNPKFATLLGQFGVPCPMKVSPTTGKLTYALAKSDQGLKDLQEHYDPHVQALVAARLGVKSTLEETRTQRFIDIAGRGNLPVPVRYYAAHTGRWGGDDKINLQNLPSRGPNAKALKKCIVAPEGYSIVESDSSQIEARMLAWLAGQYDVVETFASKGDVYKKMASAIYGVDEADVTKDQRFVGKTTVLGCFAADTKVLTPRGWVPIVDVTVTDKVWDGEEWVAHKGVVSQGVKKTIRFSGVAATPGHEILTEHGWQEWSGVITSPSLFQSALRLASSKSFGGSQNPAQAGTPWSAVVVSGKEWWTALTSRLGARLAATSAQNRPATESGGLNTVRYYPTTPTASGYSTGYPRAYPAATQKQMLRTTTTGGAVSKCTRHGAQTARHFFAICLRLMGGMSPRENLTGLTTGKVMSRGTSASPRSLRTPETSAVSPIYRQRLMTYDIAFAGPRNRYTIATDAGALIVHNCGYGMGGEKFQLALKNSGVEITKAEAAKIISIYRETNDMISGMWKQAGTMLRYMVRGDAMPFGKDGVLGVDTYAPGIVLPNGLLIRYDDLREQEGEKGGVEYSYKTRIGRTRIYGGKCLAGDTEVLTDSGWLPLRSITREHRVWDGIGWVNHAGLIYQGMKATTVIGGVRMTPDHNILTERGWRCASSSEGLHRAGFWLPDGTEVSGDKWATLGVGLPVQLRDGSFADGYRRGKVCPSWWAPVVPLGFDARPQGQQRGLHSAELSLGISSDTGGESAQHAAGGHTQGTRGDWRFTVDPSVSLAPEPVYDLLNAGPESRFVVRGSTGPFIVHNCVENGTQALARLIIGEQMLRIGKKYRVVLTVHDSIVCCVPDDEADACKAYVEECMRWVPAWAEGLPVDCEAGIGKNYGECEA